MATISDLLAYCRSQARIEAIDYFDPRYPRADEVKAWRSDKAQRDYARKLCFKQFFARLRNGSELLVPGEYGPHRRLIIADSGEIDYIPGQYAPLEIYTALLSYLQATN